MATVALFGDSTYHTWYLRAEENALLVTNHGKAPDYDGALDRQLATSLTALGASATVTNHGVDGMDSSEALSTAYADPTRWALLKAAAPDAVIIGFGVNDQGVSVETYAANLGTMVSEAIAAGIVPVLATTVYVDYPTHYAIDLNALLDPYNAALIAVAAANGLTLVDVRREFYSTIAHGRWDIFGHNDGTYLASWSGATSGTIEDTTQLHPWVAGTHLTADCMARALVKHEPLFGGTAGLADRSVGVALTDLAIRSIPILKAV